MKLTPTTLGNRIEALDMLRGFALLGIFIANMLHFHTPYLYIDPYTWFNAPGDMEAFKWIDIFVEASFYPVFAMLFGYGLNMQYEKSIADKTVFAPMMARRMGILLVFGLLHALFIWMGDILFTYAVMGFAMIAFVRIPKKWMLPLATIMYIIPSGLMYAFTYYLNKLRPDAMMEGYADIHQIERSLEAYAHGTYGEIFSFRFFEWLLYGLTGSLTGLFIILPLIMFGAGLSKWKVIERASEWKGRIAIVTIVALAAGVWMKAAPYTGGPSPDGLLLQTQFGGPVLAIGYIGLLLLLFQLPLLRTLFRPISKAGRMSLTTYITQSIVATLIFYAYGFGMYGKVDVATGTWIAVGVFAIQVIFAELWLSKFRMGPLEWLWRKGTYKKDLQDKEEKGHRLS
ncbi:DUF418 domain-containing protein [Sporosarcina sp. JAI121]|uniref:DUF418 domain-containing protein n=1 Tax=Sporosarcina sp. JAI121 TaxID=2723064 RepID=UPI0017C528EB|nr:DUF418 domain-containing protein [Sporosarcina sp. JAI121]NYF23969.1 uncharacterized protein [Sporosarcina sp. JAI121]